jgi:hypothetical protein
LGTISWSSILGSIWFRLVALCSVPLLALSRHVAQDASIQLKHSAGCEKTH